MDHLTNHEGWRIQVIDRESTWRLYQDRNTSREDFLAPPNFAKSSSVDHDVELRNRIDVLIRQCESVSGIPASRVLLTGERDLGRPFGSEHYYQPSSALAIAARKEPEAPRAILRRVFHFANESLDHFEPDLLIGGQNAQFDHLAIILCALARGIPVAFNRPSKIASGRAYWTTRMDLLNEAAQSCLAEFRQRDLSPCIDSVERLEAFREAPKTVEHIARRWHANESATFFNDHKRFALLAASRMKRALQGSKDLPAAVWPRMHNYYRMRFVNARQRHFFTSFQERDLGELPYVYLALHKEPELAINLLAPGWRNQKNLVAILAAALPFGFELLVREHRFNLGRRPMSYYQDISHYPNVTLVNPIEDQFKYVQNADLVVTDNGTTGWEGLVFGKPVIQLAESFYSHGGLSQLVVDPSEIGRAMINALERREWKGSEQDRILALMIDAELATTFLIEPECYGECVAALKACLFNRHTPATLEALSEPGRERSHG